MRIIDALKYKRSLRSGIIATVVIALILPIIQTGFFQNSFRAWYLTLLKSPLNSTLYLAFSLLFGLLVSLQIYNLKNPKLCKDCNTKKGASTGYFGAFFGFFVGICPACVGLIGLIFPLGISLTLTYYSWIFMLVSIAIMLLSLYLLGGFKKE